MIKKIGKHIWKRKNLYGHLVGSVTSGGVGFLAGAKSYAGVINYRPGRKKEMQKIIEENKKAIRQLNAKP